MAVSDNFSFSLLDVMVEFGEWTKVPRQQLPESDMSSLADCFNSNNYNASGFDSTHGNPTALPNTLREFRNYDHDAVPFAPTLSISTSQNIPAGPPFNGDLTYDVDITSNTSWSLAISYGSGSSGWANLSSTSGTGNDEDPTITYDQNGDRDNPSPARSLTLTATTTYSGGNNISRSVTVTQEEWPDGNNGGNP